MKDDMGPLPEVHPRSVIVRRAETELMGLVIDWHQKHELTLCEQLAIQAGLLSSSLWRAVRSERESAKEEKIEEEEKK